MDRIIWHWTAGADGFNEKELDSYNELIARDGTWSPGEFGAEAQVPPLIPGRYAAHTLNCNSNSYGISCDAMADAVERPFDPGKYPLTEAQIETLVQRTAFNCRRFIIPVTRKTVLSHAEVQPTLGIKQKQKWDITWLPGMDKPGDPVAVGDKLRERIIAAMLKGAPAGVPAAPPSFPPTIRRGDIGSPVADAQRRLQARGYDITPDSKFGRLTEAAVKEFQGKRGLKADGIVGPATWSRLLA